MPYKPFYAAVFLLGATVGALHGLSLSPVSSAVLQILGTIAASAVGLVAGTGRKLPTAIVLRQTLPALTAIIFAVLAGYWAGWGVTKLYLADSYRLTAELADLSSKQKVDAYRLIAIGRAVGVPKAVSEARISQLALNPEALRVRRLDRQEETRAIARLALEAGNCKRTAPEAYVATLDEIAKLDDDARKVITRFSGNKWVMQYLDLRMNTLLIPLPEDAPDFNSLMTAAGCNLDEKARRQIAALERTLKNEPTTIEGEIRRILANTPDVSSESLLRDPGVENEAF